MDRKLLTCGRPLSTQTTPAAVMKAKKGGKQTLMTPEAFIIDGLEENIRGGVRKIKTYLVKNQGRKGVLQVSTDGGE